MAAKPHVQLSRRFRFSASHRLHVDHLSADRNREIFGKCNNPFGHGHNYTVQVTVAGPIDEATGMIINLADVDGFTAREVLPRFHYANLNEDAAFKDRVPSTENLCLELWSVFQTFAAQYEGLALRRIRVEETSNNAFDYLGEGAPAPALD